MPGEVSTIQSLKAVDAWIDVINSNINGGVRTAFKASRLKFAGSNTNVDRPGNSTSLPLQFPEPSLVTQNTIIDFTQGAVTASTENSHLAIQGTGWFTVIDAGSVTASTGAVNAFSATTKVFLTRDGEFRTNQYGMLVNSNGYYLVSSGLSTGATVYTNTSMHLVYNDMDNPGANANATTALKLTDFINNSALSLATSPSSAALGIPATATGITKVTLGQQSLQYTQFGSTVFNMGFNSTGAVSTQIQIQAGTTSDASVLNKSLEASNASMTQSVPELSLAQKLFSALTKVLQTKQTNIDGVINLIR
jgi:flagellar hook protein FlgE